MSSPQPVSARNKLAVASNISSSVSCSVFSAIRVYALLPNNKATGILTFLLLSTPPLAALVRAPDILCKTGTLTDGVGAGGECH